MTCELVGQAQLPYMESIFYLSQEKKGITMCGDGH